MKNGLTVGEILKIEDAGSISIVAAHCVEDEILAQDSNYMMRHEDALNSLVMATARLEDVENMIAVSDASGNIGDEFKTEDAIAYAATLGKFLDDNDVDATYRAEYGLSDLKVEDGFAGSTHALRTEDAKKMLETIKNSIVKFIDATLDFIRTATPKMAAFFSMNESLATKLAASVDKRDDALIEDAKLDVDRLVANLGGYVPFTKDDLLHVVAVANGEKTAKALVSAGDLVAAEGDTNMAKVETEVGKGIVSGGSKEFKETLEASAKKVAGDDEVKKYVGTALHGATGAILVVTDKGIKKGSISVDKPADAYKSAKMLSRADIKSIAEDIAGKAKNQSKQVKEVSDALNKVAKLVKGSKELKAEDKTSLNAIVGSLSNICFGGAKTSKAVLAVASMNAKLYKEAAKK